MSEEIRIITVRGIGEGVERNMLSQVVDHFPNTRHVELPWTAVYGPVGGHPFDESFEQATKNAEELLKMELDKGPALVVGYSGGAEVAGNVAATGHPHIIATGLVADPSANRNIDGNYGIRGVRRGSYPEPVRWVSNYDDVICCCPDDSPLRVIAETSSEFSLADPVAWGLSIISRLNSKKFWEIVRNPLKIRGIAQRYEDAYVHACLYLGRNPDDLSRAGRNAHTAYQLDDLAWWLANKKRGYEIARTKEYTYA